MSFAQALRQHRLSRGLTQNELAELARLSARAISDLERGLKLRPRPSTVRLLAEALRLQSDEAARLLQLAQDHDERVRPQPAGSQHLPAELSTFVGREWEVQQVQSLLRGGRLLTLTGTGGIGKTRLALRIGATYGTTAVRLVELAPVSDPLLLPQAVATALNLHNDDRQTLTTRLRDQIGERDLLIWF